MLLIDTTAMEVILITITSLIGIASVSAAMEGYIMGNLNWFQRILMLVGGLMMIYPGAMTDAIGIALSGAFDSGIHSLVKGFMVESYIEDGNQKIGGGVYGKSITDACLGWEKTERLIYEIADMA